MIEVIYVLFCKFFASFFILPILIRYYNFLIEKNNKKKKLSFSSLLNFCMGLCFGSVVFMISVSISWSFHNTFKADENVADTFHGICILIDSLIIVYIVGSNKYEPYENKLNARLHHFLQFFITTHTTIYFGLSQASYINEIPASTIVWNGIFSLSILFICVFFPSYKFFNLNYLKVIFIYGIVSLSKSLQIKPIQSSISNGPFLWNVNCCTKNSIDFFNILHNIFGIPLRLSLVDFLLQIIYITFTLSVPTILRWLHQQNRKLIVQQNTSTKRKIKKIIKKKRSMDSFSIDL